jgi:ABC-type transport system involved in cytochrome c biogenesis ATPase subunit
MRLSRLELTNYRCFESLGLDLEQTTVLVGANDTGKSTILEAVRVLFDGVGTSDEWQALRTRGATGPTIVVGELSDLTSDDEARVGTLAFDGCIRIARIAPSTKLWALVTSSQLDEVLRAVDPEVANGFVEHVGADDVRDAFVRSGLVRAIGDGFAIEEGVWEFGQAGAFMVMEDLRGGAVAVIPLGGRTDTAWSPLSVVLPIVRRRLDRISTINFLRERRANQPEAFQREVDLYEALGLEGYARDPDSHVEAGAEALATLNASLQPFFAALSAAHTRALGEQGPFESVSWTSQVSAQALTDAVLGALETTAVRSGATHALSAESLGPGARRRIALAALDLYRDPELWPISENFIALLLVEEPETGLHPAAQREVAHALRGWATHGLQMLVVTHSPAILNAAPPSGIRVARREPEGALQVVQPVDLGEVRDALGVTPADILLARRFVIVEGDSDRAILDAWARRLGMDLRASAVQLVPSGGYSGAERVARFLSLAYEGADFLVVLDNGSDSGRALLEIGARFGSRVSTALLTRTEIEGYFTAPAVEAWLRVHGAEGDVDTEVGEALSTSGSRARGLNKLAVRLLNRPYDKLADGMAIANLTREEHVAPEIVSVLQQAIAD